jgi:hypothetical protein
MPLRQPAISACRFIIPTEIFGCLFTPGENPSEENLAEIFFYFSTKRLSEIRGDESGFEIDFSPEGVHNFII